MTFLNTLISNSEKIVGRWHGQHARMLDLTMSHVMLRIIVTCDDVDKNLVIACLAPEHIIGPTSWNENELAIESTILRSGENGIAVVDKKNGVCVVAESFEVKENVRI
jgi:hypothetical protein